MKLISADEGSSAVYSPCLTQCVAHSRCNKLKTEIHTLRFFDPHERQQIRAGGEHCYL